MSRSGLTLLIALPWLGCAGCASPPADDGADDLPGGTDSPHRATLPSYLSTEVQRGRLEGIAFEDASWQIPQSQKARIRSAATWLKVHAARVVLAGGAEVSSPEYARQLGQQRAMAVKEALMDEGIPANKITTVSYGLDLPGKTSDRVEFGTVPTGEKPF